MHLNLLKENPDLLQIYARLGLETIELAESAGSAEPGPSPSAEITKLLRQALTEGCGKESAEGWRLQKIMSSQSVPLLIGTEFVRNSCSLKCRVLEQVTPKVRFADPSR